MAWIRWSRSVGVTLLALVAVVATACGSSGGNTPTQTLNRSGTITIWHGYEGTYLDAKKAIYDAYTNEFPNETINLVHKQNLTDAGTGAAGPGRGHYSVAASGGQGRRG